MANKNLFSNIRSSVPPPPDAMNEAGGKAYRRNDKEALAQLVMTGYLGDTFYVKAEDQLEQILDLVSHLDVEFIGKLALEARIMGFMKDTPAVLCAILATRGEPGLAVLDRVFDRVINNGKMLKNFVQIIRSGRLGRKSLGTAPKKLVRRWFAKRDVEQIFSSSVGSNPSLGDVIKLAHPRPDSKEREALYAYLIGKKKTEKELPELVREYEAFKRGEIDIVPEVPFEMLTSSPLSPNQWKAIAQNMTWNQLRMNINTLQRHQVFDNKLIVAGIAQKIRTGASTACVFPYQIYNTLRNLDPAVPYEIRASLEDALDISLGNIPSFGDLRVLAVVDVSGSMNDPIGGVVAGGIRSTIRNRDVAALIGAALARKGATVWCVNERLFEPYINPRDTVTTIANKLAQMPPGGTKLSIAYDKILSTIHVHYDLVIFISDNQSWMDKDQDGWNGNVGVAKSAKFLQVKRKNPRFRAINIDLTPMVTKGEFEHRDILNVGGFSDRVFEIMKDFALEAGVRGEGFWVSRIEAVNL